MKGGERKLRRHSKLAYLTEEQETQLCDWLWNGRFTYRRIAEMARDKWGIKIWPTDLTYFYSDHILPLVIDRRRRTARVAAGYADEAQLNPAKFRQSTMDALEEKACTAALQPETNLTELKVYLQLLIKLWDQQLSQEQILLKARRLEFLERRQRRLEATLKDPRLKDDEIAMRCRLIFGQNGNGNTIDTPTEKTEESKERSGFSS